MVISDYILVDLTTERSAKIPIEREDKKPARNVSWRLRKSPRNVLFFPCPNITERSLSCCIPTSIKPAECRCNHGRLTHHSTCNY